MQAAPRSAQHSRSQSAAAEAVSGNREKGLLSWGFLRRRGAGQSAAAGVASKGAQVWATWRGPEAGKAGGYEPLLDGGQDGQQGDGIGGPGPEVVELSPPRPLLTGGSAADSTASMPGRPQLAVQDRQTSDEGGEEGMTPRHLHSHLLTHHRQSLLSSPLSVLSAGVKSA